MNLVLEQLSLTTKTLHSAPSLMALLSLQLEDFIVLSLAALAECWHLVESTIHSLQ
jgi:protein-tyrosine phosphatase